eukprot:2175089-Amphidinium_carterae.1
MPNMCTAPRFNYMFDGQPIEATMLDCTKGRAIKHITTMATGCAMSQLQICEVSAKRESSCLGALPLAKPQICLLVGLLQPA